MSSCQGLEIILVSSLVALKYRDRKELRGQRAYFSTEFCVMAHDSIEVTAMGLEGVDKIIYNQ